MDFDRSLRYYNEKEKFRKIVIADAEASEGMPVLVKVVSGTPDNFQMMLDVYTEELCKKRGYRISKLSNLVENVTFSKSRVYKERHDARDAHSESTVSTFYLSETFVFEKDSKSVFL